MTPQGLLMSQ